MRLFKPMLLFWIAVLMVGGWIFQTASTDRSVQAQTGATPTPTGQAQAKRKAKIKIAYTQFDWWLSRYSNNKIVCYLSIDHEGWPVANDIKTFCDQKIYNDWLQTKPCDLSVVNSYNQCPGFYLQQLGSREAEREIVVDLPLPTVWISITNCNAQAPDVRCTTLPSLQFKAEEPLPNETIIGVQGTIGNDPFQCMGDTCTIPLKPTGMDGISVEFWANSSFGDATQHYTARVRLVPWGDFMNPENNSSDPFLWYADVLSSQWRDGKMASCAETWQVFPSIGGPPDWLKQSDTPEDLQTETSYYYLAGAMITYGIVDASGCLDGGLQAPNIASPCGVDAARPQLIEWQNRFDGEILQAAKDTGVPARLLKNVFSRESQIWPGIYKTYKEAGLGQMTSNGADTILLWNPDFYHQFCPLVLDNKYCQTNFSELGDFEKNLLRGALVKQVDASCPGCPAGIDLTDANSSVHVFAESLLANCEQVGQSIRYNLNTTPGQVASYEDLWRFTLVNYNAGAGCLINAINASRGISPRLEWGIVSSKLQAACQGSIGYVEDISGELKPTPTPTAWLPRNDQAPTPVFPRVVSTFTPTPTSASTPTPTFTVTPTVTGTLPTTTPTVTITGTLPTRTVTSTPTRTVTPTGSVTP